MKHLGSNIRFLRKKKGWIQAELADKIGVNRSAIGAYEEGRVEPRLHSIMKLCTLFNTNIDTLFNIDLNENLPISQEPDVEGKNLRILPVTIDRETKDELVTLVPEKAAAGYTKGYGDVEYIEKLPKFSLPFPELSKDRSYRVFQIEGDSMLPIASGSYIICEYVMDWKSIKSGDCYVILTLDEGLVFKRVYNKLNQGELFLKSDNPDFQSYSITDANIVEVWKATAFMCFTMPDEQEVKLSIHQLAHEVNQLRSDINSIKQNKAV